jgi:hypothetical protein
MPVSCCVCLCSIVCVYECQARAGLEKWLRAALRRICRSRRTPACPCPLPLLRTLSVHLAPVCSRTKHDSSSHSTSTLTHSTPTYTHAAAAAMSLPHSAAAAQQASDTDTPTELRQSTTEAGSEGREESRAGGNLCVRFTVTSTSFLPVSLPCSPCVCAWTLPQLWRRLLFLLLLLLPFL